VGVRKDSFQRHSVHQLIEQLQKEVKDVAAGSTKGMLDLDEQIELLEYVKWTLAESDSALLQERTLDQIVSRLQPISDYMRSSPFRSSLDPDSSEFIAFSTDLSNYLTQAVEVFPYPRTRKVHSKEAAETIADFKAQSRTAVNSVKQISIANQESLRKDILALKQELDREKKLLKAQQDQVALLQQSVAENQASLATDASAKATQFDDLIAKRNEQLALWSNEIETSGANYLKKIEDYYNLTASTTLAGRFVQAAREENVSYWINLAASIMFFLLAIGLVVWETRWPASGFLSALSDPLFRWLGKLSLVAVCVIPAGIFATQATKHRRAATWYKTVGVRIATLKPYLSEFNGDYTAELKEILKGFFMSDLNADGPRHERSTPGLKELDGVVAGVEKIRGFFVK
jgi:hypothetical protein